MPPIQLTAQWSNAASAIFKKLSLLCCRFVQSQRKQTGLCVYTCMVHEKKKKKTEGEGRKKRGGETDQKFLLHISAWAKDPTC